MMLADAFAYYRHVIIVKELTHTTTNAMQQTFFGHVLPLPFWEPLDFLYR